jgi:1,4-dihydroxy-2-naphthoyl-CoA hydrolase
LPDLPDVSLENAPAFLRGSGLQVEEATGTRVTGTIAAGPDHHTPWGVVHGGVYTTAVESACSIGASLAVVGRDEYAVGISNQTDFLRPHVAGDLRVTATPIHQGRTQQLWLCEIVRAEDGKAVARGQLRLQNVALPEGARRR